MWAIKPWNFLNIFDHLQLELLSPLNRYRKKWYNINVRILGLTPFGQNSSNSKRVPPIFKLSWIDLNMYTPLTHHPLFSPYFSTLRSTWTFRMNAKYNSWSVNVQHTSHHHLKMPSEKAAITLFSFFIPFLTSSDRWIAPDFLVRWLHTRPRSS